MIALEAKNLTKQYGQLLAVNHLSFQLREGEILSFLGVNGAGKTTTLRMLAGILRPSSGIITVCGHDINTDSRLAKSKTGFIPDMPHVYPRLTGREYLEFVAELYGVPKAEVPARIAELLEHYRLTPWANELTGSYSHGMRQRLSTCAALIFKPHVLILDEPMVGLDPHGAKLLKDSLREYANNGLAVLLSTHSLNVAEEIADRIAIIHAGTVLATGTLAELKSLVPEAKSLEDIFLTLTTKAAKQSLEEDGESVDYLPP